MTRFMLSLARQGLFLTAMMFVAIAPAFAHNPADDADKAADQAAKVEHYKLYARLGGGYNDAAGQSFANGRAQFNGGAEFDAAVGYKINQFRVEGEYSVRQNNVHAVFDTSGLASEGPGGKLLSNAAMLNGYWDIPVTTHIIKPYIGAGIGFARVHANSYKNSGTPVADGEDDLFAYQGIIGSNFNISDTFGLYLEYKYFATSDIDLTGGQSAKYENNSAVAGIKYNFY